MLVTPERDPSGSFTHARDVYPEDVIAQFKKQRLWRDELLVDFLEHHANGRRKEIAIVNGDQVVSWGELNARVNRLAAAFLNLGLTTGDFVGIQLPNRTEFVEAYLAIQKAGLCALTMMSIFRDVDMTYMLNRCRVKLLVIPAEYRGFDHVAMIERIRRDIPTLKHILVVGGSGERMREYESVFEAGNPSDDMFAGLRPDPDGISKVTFTSGTTDLPKAVVHTHNTDMVTPVLTARALGLNSATPVWMPSPLAHATGLLFGVYTSLYCGTKLVLQEAWDPVHALELISRERVAFTVSATPFIDGLLRCSELSSYDLNSFQYFVSGGARIPPELVTTAKDRMGCMLLRVFGQSEAPLHTLNHPTDPWEKLVSRDGRPLPGCDVRIVDEGDRSKELPRGEVGEYSTWGPHVFLGYLDDPERTWEAKDRSGRYFSGDLCLQDEDDFILYVDRIKDIVNRGGIKFSAMEVENLLLAHPAIVAVAVVAYPDDLVGERACAFVVLAPGRSLDLEDLRNFLKGAGVTKQKWPERLEIVSGLPTTPTGKVMKASLRNLLVS